MTDPRDRRQCMRVARVGDASTHAWHSGTVIGKNATTRSATPVAWLVAGLLVAPAGAFSSPARYTIDPEHVTVGFLVSHIDFARVLGVFGDVEGTFEFDEDTGELSNISVVVATASVSTHHEDRDNHLRSGDFLDSRRFPEMTFTAATAKRTGDRTFEIVGELELRGQRRPLTLEATWNKSGDYPLARNAYAVGVSARGTLSRRDFGITYALDNGWVGDTVEIIIELEARRQ
jgi:polyisoprenoid-binding protein YceI